jgi:hypothetical protein
MKLYQKLIGYVVVQLVEALCYKLEGCGFNFHWGQWNFSLTYSFWLHYGPCVNLAFNRNEHQEYLLRGKGSRCVGLRTSPPSNADYLKILKSQSPIQGLVLA